MPINVLDKSKNSRISLLLKDDRRLEGKLVGYDEYMNLVLEDTEETIELEAGESGKSTSVKKLGRVILRGNNIVTISPFPK